MVRYTSKIIIKAKKLAIKEHLSYKEIGRRLKISDSTISIWCRDIKGNNPRKYVKTSEEIRKIAKRSDVGIFRKIKFDVNLAKIFCGIIYGCEGSKYPASNCINFTNSEPKLVISFVNLLRNSYKLDEAKWRAHLQIHDSQNPRKLIEYWSRILKIPINKFYKSTITKTNEGKHRVNYLGTCTVKYYDYKLQLKLIGIFEAFMRKLALHGGVA